MNNSLTFEVTTPGDREVVMTREFSAPKERVWDAMTKPEYLRRWLLGPPGWSMTVCDSDLKPGGVFRWAWSGPDGAQIAMHGVYREVSSPDKIVRTEQFDTGCDAQSGEQFGTLSLTDIGSGRTKLTITVLYPSREARDATVASGMTRGVTAGYDRLDEVLATEPA